MREIPGAATPWLEVNRLLAPDERFELVFPQGAVFLLAPKQASQAAALLFFLSQEQIAYLIEGRESLGEFKNGIQPPIENRPFVIVSSRAFVQMKWNEDGAAEVGSGCPLTQLHQFLYERNQEIAIVDSPFASLKRSVGDLILSGRATGTLKRSQSLPEILLGAEIVTADGACIKWGGSFASPVAGPGLHQLLFGLQGFPGILVKVTLKTSPIPPARLRLAWRFSCKEALWRQFHELKGFASSWECLDAALSGNADESAFLFAQISGLQGEMEAFSKGCPEFAKASQKGEKGQMMRFFLQQKLHCSEVEKDFIPPMGEYLFLQDSNEKGWLLSGRKEIEPAGSLPVWKEKFYKKLMKGFYGA